MAGSVLFKRNFWPFFVGNLTSNCGTWFQNIAQVLLVYRLTHSPFWVGVVNFSQFAAIVVLAPLAGNAADRFDRRRLVMLMQVCAAMISGCLSLITAAGLESTPVVIGAALLVGITLAVSTPALQAMVPSLLSRDQLPRAVALHGITHNLARVIGPIAAVLVIAHWGIPTAFAVNAISFLVLAVALVATTSDPPTRKTEGRPSRLRDSLALVRTNRELSVPLIVVGLVSTSVDPVNTLTPVFSTEVFGRPDTFTGYLVGAFGIGAIASAIVMAKRSPHRGEIAITLSLIAVGMSTFSLSTSESVALGGLFVAGFGYLATLNAATSLLHLSLEESHRGRVMALWSVSFLGMRPVASAIDGGLASLFGVRVAGLTMVIPVVLGCLWLAIGERRTSL
ncbi:MAG: MFS transporter [Actinobacteria bacterium]|nr:MFS transporter [Actinomycetota bacterium]